MGDTSNKPIIGIMGGICSGKSTVAAELEKLGCQTIDADKIAHELLAQPDMIQKITARFGDQILDSPGNIDRAKLAEAAFANPESIEALNAILHPPILARAEELINKIKMNPTPKGIVLDLPLLMEVGWDKKCDFLIFVTCNEDLRAQRARKKGEFGENQVKMREKFQISLDSKVAIADNVIDGNSDLFSLARQVNDFFSHKVMGE